MARYIHNKSVIAEMIKRGLVPNDCRSITLDIVPDGAFVIRYERFIPDSELALLGEALTAAAGVVKQ